jgi:hypothetical protein
MSNGRQLFVVAVILATFGAFVVAGGPALDPGESSSSGLDSADQEQSPGSEVTVEAEAEPVEEEESTGEETEPASTVVHECAAEPPRDYADPAGNSSETIGWVGGYWYSEPLDINETGGLNESELDQVSARTAARFEALRCLTADEGVPPVEIQTREQFSENQSGLFDVSRDRRLADNAQLAVRLMSGTETDSTEQREQNRGASVGGTYNFLTEQIVIVSDDPENLAINEAVLAHEIGHAIQDQHFDLIQYDRDTVDRDKAILGLIEGDVRYIERQYNRACSNGGWEQGCLSFDNSGESDGGSGPSPANWGLLFQTLQPYNDGPAFIEHTYETENGWESVNDLYDEPPTSALEVIRPERYPEFAPENMTVPDRSTAEWQRYNSSLGPAYEQVGVAGISAMFMAPFFESTQETIYDRLDLLASGDLRTYQYFHPETEGWRGDRLYTYQGDKNETGAVWTTRWESAADAVPFVQSYTELIEIRGGEAVGEQTYTFGGDSGYDMALTIRTDGPRVTIVTAPTVEQLDEVHPPESAG